MLSAAYCLLPTAYSQGLGGVKGKVKAMNGSSIAGATIVARQNGKDLRSATANSKGEFVLSGLDAGVYNFVFDAKGYATGVKYNVEIKDKIKDLGGNLILMVDRGSRVIIQGSVFFKDGTSVGGAKIEIEKVTDGSPRKIASGYTSYSGEFSFSQPEGATKYRVTATYKGSTASKDIDVTSAAIYRMAISLEINRTEKP